ncbi:MAG TPA: CBS domain-containing protein [Polyangiaceae bacterium]
MQFAAFLTPKSEVVWVSASGSVEQALERMKPNGFAAVPILDDEGCYVGTLSTSDLMWFLLPAGSAWQELARATAPLMVPRRLSGLVVHVDASVSVLIKAAIEHSFVSVVDDRGVFVGIVRRRPVIEYCARLADPDGVNVKAFGRGIPEQI